MVDAQVSASAINVIGDAKTREVLATLSIESYSAKELAEKLDVSEPTIYRRLGRLEKHNLVNKRTIVTTDGNHYSVYECNFQSAIITLQEGEFFVWFNRKDNLADKFADLWETIRRIGTE